MECWKRFSKGVQVVMVGSTTQADSWLASLHTVSLYCSFPPLNNFSLFSCVLIQNLSLDFYSHIRVTLPIEFHNTTSKYQFHFSSSALLSSQRNPCLMHFATINRFIEYRPNSPSSTCFFRKSTYLPIIDIYLSI